MHNTRILIVEDEAIIAMEIESQLQSLGHEVTSIVDTGEKAIEKAEADKPDLILMDIRIKGEMDGIDAAEVIRNQFGIPVIFSTAYLDEERIERAKITMPFGYVLKPIKERELRITIEMALYVNQINLERNKVEQSLIENEKYLTKAQKIAKIGHWKVDAKTMEVIGSDELFNIFGLTRDEFTLEKFVSIVHPEDREYDLYYINRGMKEGKPWDIEHRLLLRDGTEKYIRAMGEAVTDQHNVVIEIVGIVQDISDQKSKEEKIKRSEKHLQDILNATWHPFYVIDVKTRIIKHANIATGENVVGRFCHQVTHQSSFPCNSEEHPCPIDIILKTKQSTVVEHVHTQTDGKKRLFKIHATPLFNDYGEVAYIVENNFDRTERG